MTKYKNNDQFFTLNPQYEGHDSLTIVRVDTAAPFSVDNPCYDCRLWFGSYSPGVVVKFNSDLDMFYKIKGV